MIEPFDHFAAHLRIGLIRVRRRHGSHFEKLEYLHPLVTIPLDVIRRLISCEVEFGLCKVRSMAVCTILLQKRLHIVVVVEPLRSLFGSHHLSIFIRSRQQKNSRNNKCESQRSNG